MASQLSICAGASLRATVLPLRINRHQLVAFEQSTLTERRGNGRSGLRIVVRISNGGGDSYLDMWKKVVDREREEIEFRKIVENSGKFDKKGESEIIDHEALERKSNEFKKILEVSKEERDRIQRMQVIDRAAAAIAAARAIVNETGVRKQEESSLGINNLTSEDDERMEVQREGEKENGTLFGSRSGISSNATPGSDFWTWTPPLKTNTSSNNNINPETLKNPSPYPATTNPVLEKDHYIEYLPIPFETKLSENTLNPLLPLLPPLQSFIELEKAQISSSTQEVNKLGVQFSTQAEEAARALNKVDELSSDGEYSDGSRWWKETGIETRPNGVVCKWTLMRGVSADQAVEWEEKFWEAADEFDYKELGSEKLGRDANGNVWREFWKETMWQDRGLLHIEKTADKWGENGKGDEWQEQWWEQYNASGQAEKWAHKWSSIDPNTRVDAGHAHIWHERWGEKYDGRGGSTKYTDKWAEQYAGDGWTKWGDKWDEQLDLNGHGVKQGETWWEGKHGEKWNRTWGEGHNGSGWVHKYGKSSSGEHWDTHEEQDTWYERFPHYGFMHCFDNSVQLRDVQKPSQDL